MDLLGVGPCAKSHELNSSTQPALLTAFKEFENAKPLNSIRDHPKYSSEFCYFGWIHFERYLASFTSHSQTSTILDKAVEMTALSQKRTANNVIEVCSDNGFVALSRLKHSWLRLLGLQLQGKTDRQVKQRSGSDPAESSGASERVELCKPKSNRDQVLSHTVTGERHSGDPAVMLNGTSGDRNQSQPHQQVDAAENDARASRSNISDAELACTLDTQFRKSTMQEGLHRLNGIMHKRDAAAPSRPQSSGMSLPGSRPCKS